jgi:hypothetical protein
MDKKTVTFNPKHNLHLYTGKLPNSNTFKTRRIMVCQTPSIGKTKEIDIELLKELSGSR